MTRPSGPPPGIEARGNSDAHALAVLLLATALGVGTLLPLLGRETSGLPQPRPAGGAAPTPTRSTSSVVGTLNLNTADAETLQALPGIGPALAERIVAYRLEHGPFQTVEDLRQVPGIGPKRWERIRPWIRHAKGVVAEEP